MWFLVKISTCFKCAVVLFAWFDRGKKLENHEKVVRSMSLTEDNGFMKQCVVFNSVHCQFIFEIVVLK